jgi:DNA-binding response OmpR family regulator
MRLQSRGHILVWTLNTTLAGRMRQAFEQLGFETTWAAALHEAIAALDRHFPLAIACTLEGEIPSLMDLETLMAYESMGHKFISLPPTPVWALTRADGEYADKVRCLGLPVHLFSPDEGPVALAEEVAQALLLPGRNARPLRGEDRFDVLLVDPDDEEGICFVRYLQSRGIRCLHVTGPEIARETLGKMQFGVVVTEIFEPRGARAPFLDELAAAACESTVVVVTSANEWLQRVSVASLPRNVACAMGKPVSGQALEVCLRRLLRIAAPGAAPASVFVGQQSGG